jgi:hypothetical protein
MSDTAPLVTTRNALHALAERVISPLRDQATGNEIALQPRPGGFDGVSPGDEEHDEPYAYLAPWTAPAPGRLWQARGFTGAETPARDADAIVAFWRERRAALAP